MANTITEYGYLSNSPVLKGIVKTIVNESPFLARLPFREIAGNSLIYNLESTEAGVQSYVTGDTWVEGTTVWAQRTSALLSSVEMLMLMPSLNKLEVTNKM